MFIETMFMRYGHGPGGLIGIKLNEKAVHRLGTDQVVSLE